MNFYIGTMGYSYQDWRNGVFYPAGTSPNHLLAYYSQIFNAVEMDTTFYGTPRPSNVHKWMSETPDHFCFCPKTPRLITHDLRLNDEAKKLMAQFLETMRLFGNKLGPILIQFPPEFAIDQLPLLQAFLPILPADLRFSIEFRHRSWYKRAISELLHTHQIAWTSTDYIYMPKQVHATTDFIYLRLLGRHGNYSRKDREQEDSTARLQEWWQQMQPLLPQMKAVYIFANNDYAGHSPTTCRKFQQITDIYEPD